MSDQVTPPIDSLDQFARVLRKLEDRIHARCPRFARPAKFTAAELGEFAEGLALGVDLRIAENAHHEALRRHLGA